MSSNHKAPLAAFVVVAIACVVVLATNSMRSYARDAWHTFAAPVVGGLQLVRPHDGAHTHAPRVAPAAPVRPATSPALPADAVHATPAHRPGKAAGVVSKHHHATVRATRTHLSAPVTVSVPTTSTAAPVTATPLTATPATTAPVSAAQGQSRSHYLGWPTVTDHSHQSIGHVVASHGALGHGAPVAQHTSKTTRQHWYSLDAKTSVTANSFASPMFHGGGTFHVATGNDVAHGHLGSYAHGQRSSGGWGMGHHSRR